MATPVEQFQTEHVRPKPGPALVIGSKVFAGRQDRRELFQNVTGLDVQPGDGVDIVHDMELPLGERFAHIDCVSVLEHCKRPWLVAENIEAAMRTGATIFLTVPFVWRWHGYESDYWRFTAEGVRALFPRINWLAMMYGHQELVPAFGPGQKTPCQKIDGHPYFPRCEVFGFGVMG